MYDYNNTKSTIYYNNNNSVPSLSLQCTSSHVKSPNNVETRRVVIAKGNSAASKHFIRPQDKHCLTDVRAHKGTPVQLPDSSLIQTSEQGTLPLPPILSKAVRTGTVLLQLASSSFIFAWSAL